MPMPIDVLKIANHCIGSCYWLAWS